MSRLPLLLSGALLASCTQSPSAPTTPPGPPSLPPPVVEPPPIIEPPPPPGPFVPFEARLHRLTKQQYANTVRALLGDVTIPTDLEVDTPLHGFTTVGASNLTVGPRAAEQYEAAALDLASQIFGDQTRREALLGCTPQNASDACVTDFLQRFGRAAFRRPLTPSELTRFQGLVQSISAPFNDVWVGLEMMTAGFLQSPHFLFRVDVGEPDPDNPEDPTRLRYTGFEMAARLSYFIWSSTPDQALLNDAQNGLLNNVQGIQAAATRLLEAPQARTALASFFDEYLKLDRLESITKDPELFPQMSPTMADSMRREVAMMIDDIVFERDADLRELIDTRSTFINDDLARLYQVPAQIEGPEFVPFTHAPNSPRAGILTTGAFLALNAHATVTSPTLRGRFIRQFLLCQEIPPPPPGVTTTLPDPDPNAGPETLRQRLERLHLAAPACAGCHNLMDPLGFGLEGFDAIGAYRTTERVGTDDNLPIDTRGTLDDVPFKNATELASLLKARTEVAACLSRMAYRYAAGHLETDGEAKILDALSEDFQDANYSFKALVLAIVTSDGFRYATPE